MVGRLLEKQVCEKLSDVKVDGRQVDKLSPSSYQNYRTSEELAKEATFLTAPRYNRLHHHCDYSKGG